MLASIGPRGAPQNHPVAFTIEADIDAIEIGGPKLRDSQKYRNLQRDPRVSLVVDDQAPPEESVGPGGQLGRGIEIRGMAELSERNRPLMSGFSRDVIRILPQRIIAWNLDGPGYNSRSVS